MSALAFDFRYHDEVAPAPAPRRRLYAVRGTVDAVTPTLDDVLSGAFAKLAAGATATCPVCAGALRPHGVCDDCGSSLS